MKWLLVASMVALAFAGCSSPDTSMCKTGSDFVTPTQDDEGRYVICMTDSFQFQPANAVVPEGSVVVWKNVGSQPHNAVASDDAWEWEGGLIGAEAEQAVTMTVVGDHAYVCQPHEAQGMKGTVRVTAS